MSHATDYKHLRAWCRMMHSHDYYTHGEILDARRENAPQDVIYRTDGKWRRFADIENAATRATIERFVAEMS